MLTLIVLVSFIISPIGVQAAAPNTISITFRQSGLGNDTTRTLLTIDGVRYLPNALPVTFDWAPNSIHTIIATDPDPAVYGKRYRFLGWDNAQVQLGNEYVVPASNEVVTAIYGVQYFLTVHARSLKPAPPIQSVINVYLNNELRGNITEVIPITFWANDTTSVSIAVNPIIPEINGTSYFFLKWDDGDTQNPRLVNINGTASYAAVYQAQYQVSFTTQTEEGSITPSETGIYVSGSSIQILAEPKIGFAFSQWMSEGQISFENLTLSNSRAVINGPGSIIAKFTDSVLITFTANQTQSDSQGTLLTIDGTSYSYSQLPQVFKWIPNSIHTVTVQLLIPVNTSKRYQQIGWIGQSRPEGTKYIVPNSNSSLMVWYRTQYFLELHNGGHGITNGGGWYNEGQNATVTISPTTVSGGTAIEWIFTGWSSSVSNGYIGSNSSLTINVEDGLNVTAHWVDRPVQLPPVWTNLIWAVNIIIVIFGVLLIIRWIRSRKINPK